MGIELTPLPNSDNTQSINAQAQCYGETTPQRIQHFEQLILPNLWMKNIEIKGQKQSPIFFEAINGKTHLAIANAALSQRQIGILQELNVKSIPKKDGVFTEIFNDILRAFNIPRSPELQNDPLPPRFLFDLATEHYLILKHFRLFGSADGLNQLEQQIKERNLAAEKPRNFLGLLTLAFVIMLTFSGPITGIFLPSFTISIAIVFGILIGLSYALTVIFASTSRYRQDHFLKERNNAISIILGIGLVLLAGSFLISFFTPSIILFGISVAPSVLGYVFAASFIISAIINSILDESMILSDILPSSSNDLLKFKITETHSVEISEDNLPALFRAASERKNPLTQHISEGNLKLYIPLDYHNENQNGSRTLQLIRQIVEIVLKHPEVQNFELAIFSPGNTPANVTFKVNSDSIELIGSHGDNFTIAVQELARTLQYHMKASSPALKDDEKRESVPEAKSVFAQQGLSLLSPPSPSNTPNENGENSPSGQPTPDTASTFELR